MKKGIDFIGVGVCYICHDGKGNFVMALRSKNCRDEHLRWDTGGGALEHGEMALDCLRREIGEEYLTEVLETEFLGVREVHREENGLKSHWVALDYKVRVDPAKVANGEPHKFEQIGWFQMNDLPKNLPENMHSQLPVFFEKYKGRL